jgi:hypothetical protein
VIAAGVTWLLAGAVVAVVGKRAPRWFFAAVFIVAGAGSVVALHATAPVSGMSVQVATCASLLLAAGGLLNVVVSEKVDGGAVVTFALALGFCGLSVASDKLLQSAEALFAAALVVGLRWMISAPGRHTVAAVRSVGLGAALLLGVTPLLPINQTAIGPWPALVAGLLVGGVALLLGLFPSGGWTVSIEKYASTIDLAAWCFILVPATLVYAQRCLVSLPDDVALTAGHLLLWVGLAGAVWFAAHSLRASGSHRYVRLMVADISLGAAALMSDMWGAVPGLQLLLVTHLVVFPFVCRREAASRGWWLVLGPVPPSSGFWARLGLAISCAGNSSQALTLALVAVALGAISSGIEVAGSRSGVQPEQRIGIRRLTPALAAAGGVVALFLALDPGQALRFAFGS